MAVSQRLGLVCRRDILVALDFGHHAPHSVIIVICGSRFTDLFRGLCKSHSIGSSLFVTEVLGTENHIHISRHWACIARAIVVSIPAILIILIASLLAIVPSEVAECVGTIHEGPRVSRGSLKRGYVEHSRGCASQHGAGGVNCTSLAIIQYVRSLVNDFV